MSTKRRCANCGVNEPEEERFALCAECYPQCCDGSLDQIRGWWAWATLINGEWNDSDLEAFADSPGVQNFLRRLVVAMPMRAEFILQEARKIGESDEN